MTVEEHIITEAKKYYSEEDRNYYNAFLHGVEFAGKLPPWISVKDDLPYKHEELIPDKERPMTKVVIIKTKYGVETSFMIQDVINDTWIWCNHEDNKDQVTHWMPFPKKK